ncbi:hypothetical protein GBO18_24730 [Mycobacterium avium subsp. hominissuis]|nr:hypothetical protein [Mycobacterium avium subsp. hominissuis]
MEKYRQLVPDAPERIFRMAESRTVDNSARLDRLVSAEIEQAKTDRSMAVVFLLIFTVASIVFFAINNPIAGGALISVPVLAVIKTMWSSPIWRTKTRKDDKDGSGE